MKENADTTGRTTDCRLDILNHIQRAMFARQLFRRPGSIRLRDNAATRLFIQSLKEV